MRVRWAAATHPGRRRASNEDAFCARPDLGLFIVADGMGGHVAGEIASRLAVDTIEATVAAGDASAADSRNCTLAERRLQEGFERASQAISDQTSRQPRLRGMATTASRVLIPNGASAIAHVGDSRVYLWRDQLLQQLTHDHSWVAEQVTMGLLSPAEARQHPWRNVVTRALSASDPPQVELSPLTLQHRGPSADLVRWPARSDQRRTHRRGPRHGRRVSSGPVSSSSRMPTGRVVPTTSRR